MFEKLKEHLGPAVSHSLYSIVYILFIIPFDLWVKAVERLAKQKESGVLNISGITSPWPLLSFIKTLLFEFLFDFWTFITYILGAMAAIYIFMDRLLDGEIDEALLALIVTLIGTYYTPLYYAWARDLCQLCLLPIQKLISWFRKPAQHLDLTVKG